MVKIRYQCVKLLINYLFSCRDVGKIVKREIYVLVWQEIRPDSEGWDAKSSPAGFAN